MGEEDIYEQELGDIIRVRRIRMKMSQKELGKEVGVGQQTVSRWESGEAVPRPLTVRKVSRSLGLSPGPLLVKAGYLEPRDVSSVTTHTDSVEEAELARVARKMQGLSDHGRKLVEDMIDELAAR